MNKNTFTHLSIFTAAAVLLSSCALDPNYRAYQQQKAATAASNAVGDAANAVTAANPYGVPQSSGEVGSYTPSASTSTTSASAAVPYQPLPGISQPAQPSNTPAPTYTGSVSPSASGSSHKVVGGDSLWALARKFGTTVEAIQAANGLTTSTIRTGQNLIIPGR